MSSNSTTIENLRKEIEVLHHDLFRFILARKHLVEQIWELKQSQKLDLIDSSREQLLIQQFDQLSELKNDKNLKEFYQNIVKNIITENKKYLTLKAHK